MKTRNRGYYKSSSFKMAVFFTVLLSMSVGILCYFGYYFNRQSYISISQEILASDIQNLSAWDNEGSLDKGLEYYKARGGLYKIDGENGTSNFAGIQESTAQKSSDVTIFEDAESGRVYAASGAKLKDGRSIQLALDVTDKSKKYNMMLALAILSVVFLLMVILTSFAISTFVVGRTGKIAETANAIMITGDLGRRIEIVSRWDDIGYMAEILNRLLARIEELMQGVKQVSNNIAHDLRTPLTRLRNKLEALQKNPDVAQNPEMRELCEGLVADADQILATFAALLRIARIETGKERAQFTNLSIHKIVKDVLELYEPLAEDKGIKIEAALSPHAREGDRDLLFQAFANLLDNAVKFTPRDGRIMISLDNGTFRITDSGPGVPESDQQKIFERFYRSEGSRSTPGNGLGLSLVAAVTGLHGIKVRTQNTNPGFAVTLLL